MKIETKHVWALSTIVISGFFGAKILTTICIVLYSAEIAMGVLVRKTQVNPAVKVSVETSKNTFQIQRFPQTFDPNLTIVDLNPPTENWENEPPAAIESKRLTQTMDVQPIQIIEAKPEMMTQTNEGIPLHLVQTMEGKPLHLAQTMEGKPLHLAQTVEGKVIRSVHELAPKHERTIQSDSDDQWATAMNLLRESPSLFQSPGNKISENSETPIDGILFEQTKGNKKWNE